MIVAASYFFNEPHRLSVGITAYYRHQIMAGFWIKLDIALDLPMLKCCCKLYADVPTSILGVLYM